MVSESIGKVAPERERRSFTLGFWITLGTVFAASIILTALKDWWLTGNPPNALFYIFVPALSIPAGVAAMCGVAKLATHEVSFPLILAITIGAATVMQVLEIVMKLVYYLWRPYPTLSTSSSSCRQASR